MCHILKDGSNQRYRVGVESSCMWLKKTLKWSATNAFIFQTNKSVRKEKWYFVTKNVQTYRENTDRETLLKLEA